MALQTLCRARGACCARHWAMGPAALDAFSTCDASATLAAAGLSRHTFVDSCLWSSPGRCMNNQPGGRTASSPCCAGATHLHAVRRPAQGAAGLGAKLEALLQAKRGHIWCISSHKSGAGCHRVRQLHIKLRTLGHGALHAAAACRHGSHGTHGATWPGTCHSAAAPLPPPSPSHQGSPQPIEQP